MPTCAMCNAAEVESEGEKCTNCGTADGGEGDAGGHDGGHEGDDAGNQGGDENAAA